MKNLAHIPLEVLELGPERIAMRWELCKPSGAPVREVERRYRYRNETYDRLYTRITKVIYSSVGKHWDSVYSRISRMIKAIRFEFDINHIVYGIVTKPFWSLRNQRWEYFPHRWGGGANDLYEHIQLLKVVTHYSPRYQEYFYYICPISGVLRLVKSKTVVRDRSSQAWRKHYKFLYDRRKARKARKKKADHILRMINNPEVLKFYTNLVAQYRIKTAHPPQGLWGEKWTEEKWMEMERLKYQIEELEKGNFDCFFESNIYLYT